MSKKEQARVGSGFAILRNGFEQKVEILRSYLVIQKQIKKIQMLFYVLTTSSLSFFLVRRAKRRRHGNDHARVHSPY